MAPLDQTAIVETAMEPALLEQAFERFTEASKRLEVRYAALLQETELLRAQVREKDIVIKRAERLAALGETAAAIAHEIRNPLGAMRLFVSALKRSVGDQPESIKLLTFIDQNISTLDHVVSNILQFAKKNSADMAPVQIHSIVRELAQHFAAGPSSSITLKLCDDVFIRGNEHALRQVFYNLLINAQQATRYHGSIVIESDTNTEGMLRILIMDSGPGIDERVSGSLFEPFVTTKNEGTGLGLAVARQIIEEHGGTISAANDGGACITIMLPCPKVKRG